MINSEAEARDWLAYHFEEHGWQSATEVSPSKSQLSVDLLVNHPEYEWIGIEVKYLQSNGSDGRKYAAAFEQVREYVGRKYFGERVYLWVVAPFYERGDFDVPQSFREFLCYFGIGSVYLVERWGEDDSVMVDFAYSDKQTKILADSPDSSEYGRLGTIRDSVLPKLGRLDGGYTDA